MEPEKIWRTTDEVKVTMRVLCFFGGTPTTIKIVLHSLFFTRRRASFADSNSTILRDRNVAICHSTLCGTAASPLARTNGLQPPSSPQKLRGRVISCRWKFGVTLTSVFVFCSRCSCCRLCQNVSSSSSVVTNS